MRHFCFKKFQFALQMLLKKRLTVGCAYWMGIFSLRISVYCYSLIQFCVMFLTICLLLNVFLILSLLSFDDDDGYAYDCDYNN